MDFALVAAEGAEADAARAEVDARRAGAPLRVLVQPAGVPVRELYGAALALVRPDQHVARRRDCWDAAVLRHATGFEGPDTTVDSRPAEALAMQA